MSKTPSIKLYRANSVPLEAVDSNSPKEGELIYSSTGRCFRCVGKDLDGASIFEQMHESELVDGEVLESIEDNHDLLRLFWKLSNRRLNKINDEYKAED